MTEIVKFQVICRSLITLEAYICPNDLLAKLQIWLRKKMLMYYILLLQRSPNPLPLCLPCSNSETQCPPNMCTSIYLSQMSVTF